MEKLRQLVDNVFSVGAIDPDRRLFDELIPLPDGTSYNSYLVNGSKKIALIDTVDPTKKNILLKNLKDAGIKKIDYVIANHAEQDHSGTLPAVIENYPMAKVICSEKCKQMLVSLLKIPEQKIQVVNDGETISLGDKTLEFIYTPWVHWPETMTTFLKEDKILFSCDFFGSHMAPKNITEYDKLKIQKAAKRYFAEIMMPFRTVIKANIEKLGKYNMKMIAPSHGAVWNDPDYIISLYKEWISDNTKNLAIVAYVSMHGSTKEAADYLAKSLEKKGVAVKLFNLTTADIGEIAVELVDASTVVVGTPCLLAGIHPTALHAVYLVNALRPKTKFVSIVGSFGWASRIVEEISPMIKNLKAEVLSPVIINGLPKENDFIALDKLAETIAAKHKALIK